MELADFVIKQIDENQALSLIMQNCHLDGIQGRIVINVTNDGMDEHFVCFEVEHQFYHKERIPNLYVPWLGNREEFRNHIEKFFNAELVGNLWVDGDNVKLYTCFKNLVYIREYGQTEECYVCGMVSYFTMQCGHILCHRCFHKAYLSNPQVSCPECGEDEIPYDGELSITRQNVEDI